MFVLVHDPDKQTWNRNEANNVRDMKLRKHLFQRSSVGQTKWISTRIMVQARCYTIQIAFSCSLGVYANYESKATRSISHFGDSYTHSHVILASESGVSLLFVWERRRCRCRLTTSSLESEREKRFSSLFRARSSENRHARQSRRSDDDDCGSVPQSRIMHFGGRQL